MPDCPSIRAACLVLVAASSIIPGRVQAGSAAVSVSLHFDVAPLDLIRARGIAPNLIRSCEAFKVKLDEVWIGRTPPTLNCRTSAQIPLIVTTSMLDGRIIARP